MNRTTIDFGIDLGTTNSAIAILKGTTTDIFKNNLNADITPSAIYKDRKNAIHVGAAAKQRIESDPEDAVAEFKRKMGTDWSHTFKQGSAIMKAEELSAEVLKALKEIVRKRSGEEIMASVITVPAAFELPQCEATQKAAQLAGFRSSPLLQEPVAAALAYGFQKEDEKAYWLVYDFGGGTFDAALIQVREGTIQVVNHGGDNHLGGSDIDWEIVHTLLMPKLTSQYQLPDFVRGNPQWRGAIAKLKAKAEEAKIQLSDAETSSQLIEYLCDDARGEKIEFEFELSQGQLARIADPFITKSINICKKVLKEKNLGPGNVERVILVGGPTLTPHFRKRLADELKIALDYSVDPLTVVARGAAVFAGTQRLEPGDAAPAATGQYSLNLKYKPVGPDTEPLVGGKVTGADGGSVEGFTLEFSSPEALVPWRSGKIALRADGAFMTTLVAEKNRTNTFLIELCDPSGTPCETAPDRFTYTVGLAISEQNMINSIGVNVGVNDYDIFVKKGDSLPARVRKVYRTRRAMSQGETGDILNIPVVEGENSLADRNVLIGYVAIPGSNLKRDLPVQSEIEVTINVDESRTIRTKAYIPILDEEWEKVIELVKRQPEPQQLKKDFDHEINRLARIRQQTDQTQDQQAAAVLGQLDDENVLGEVRSALTAAMGDRDGADKAEKRLLELKLKLDAAEDVLHWPALVAEIREWIGDLQVLLGKYRDAEIQGKLNKQQPEIAEIIESHDSDRLRKKLQIIKEMYWTIMRKQPGWWIGWLDHLQKNKAPMKDQNQAARLLDRGQQCVADNNLEGLKAAVRQLVDLLPAEVSAEMERGFQSGLIK